MPISIADAGAPPGMFQRCNRLATRAEKASTQPQKEAIVVSRSGEPYAVTNGSLGIPCPCQWEIRFGTHRAEPISVQSWHGYGKFHPRSNGKID